MDVQHKQNKQHSNFTVCNGVTINFLWVMILF